MKKLLIITTINDLSIPLFLTPQVKERISVDIFFYKQDFKIDQFYDYIYFRDPFTDEEFNLPELEEKVGKILVQNNKSYIIDSIKSFADILFEDKWVQYQLFSKFMPSTELLTNREKVDDPQYITKKRISSRAKGIVFNQSGLQGDLSSYVIQKKLEIKKEYRIYVIFGEIIKTAALKTPKTESSKTKVYDVQEISPALEEFVQQVTKQNKFDFIGLDIAETNKGYFLLEVNRSCLFNKYFSETNINLATVFIDKLLKK